MVFVYIVQCRFGGHFCALGYWLWDEVVVASYGNAMDSMAVSILEQSLFCEILIMMMHNFVEV